MTHPLYQHQIEIISDNRLWTGLFTGTGSAKTRTALELAEGKILIICPKQQREDETWQDNAKKFGIKKDITVISKEDFRRDWEQLLKIKWDTIIVDEAHYFFGVLPDTRQRNKVLIPKASQLFENLCDFLKIVQPKRFYLLTATPAGKPMNVYAIATLLGHRWDFFKFREKYYFSKKMGRFRNVWIPYSDPSLKARLVEVLKGMGYTGSLAEFFDVPEQTHIVKHFSLGEAQRKALKVLKASEADPMAVRALTRTIENGIAYGVQIEENGNVDTVMKKTTHYPCEKTDYVVEKAQEFPKMLVFATYTAQVATITQELIANGYKNVYAVTGATKDRSGVFKKADAMDECILVVQSSISEGYELPSFPVVIYASLSNKVRDKIQGDGRVLRGNALKKNLYITLVMKGGLDESCYKSISSGVDFNEMVMEK